MTGVQTCALPILDGSFRLAAPRPALELAGRYPAAAAALLEMPEYAPLARRVLRAAQLERGHLTRCAVNALYGERVPMSASRMDKHQSCHFSYFMQYGLKAEPREKNANGIVFSVSIWYNFHISLRHIRNFPANCPAEEGGNAHDI